MRKFVSLQLLAAGLAAVAALPRAQADEIHLRGGTTIQGQATREGDTVVVRLESGEIRLPASEIERIDEAESKEDIVQRRRAALGAGDLEGRLELAAYCREQGLYATERALLLEIVDREPEHARARRLLGHVKTERGWVDRSQQRRAELEAEQTARLERQRAEDRERARERELRDRERAAREAEADALRARDEARRAQAAADAAPVYFYAPEYPVPTHRWAVPRERAPSWTDRSPSEQRFPIPGARDPRDPRFHLPVNDPRFR